MKLPKCANPKPFVKGKVVIATSRGWEAVNENAQNELLVQCKGLDKIVGVDLLEDPKTDGSTLLGSVDDKNLVDELDELDELLEDEFKDELIQEEKPEEIALTREMLVAMDWDQLKALAAENEVSGNSRAALVGGVCKVLEIK